MKRECESCIKRKTVYCPTSMECMATDDMPYYQNRIMLLEENKRLKGAIQTYDILLKSNVKENEQLKEELKYKPDTEITLQDDKGNKFALIQTERINAQKKLNKTIERLFNNWNKLNEWVNKQYDYYMNNEDYIGGRLCFTDIKNKMQEIEQGSDE